MTEREKFRPDETYVLDHDEVAELEDLGLTGITKVLEEFVDETESNLQSESEVEREKDTRVAAVHSPSDSPASQRLSHFQTVGWKAGKSGID